MLCQYCGNQIPEDALNCPSCGAPRGETMPKGATQFCRHCGRQIDADCIICPKCGKQVKELEIIRTVVEEKPVTYTYAPPKAVLNQRNKWVAFVLCLLFGYFGIHKFYEGRFGLGLLYALTCGLCGIGWIIDLIVLLFKPNPYTV